MTITEDIVKLECGWDKAHDVLESINTELATLRDYFIEHELGFNPFTFKLKKL